MNPSPIRLLALLACLFLGLTAAPATAQAQPPASATPKVSSAPPLPLDALHAFVEVMQRIERDYVKPVSEKKLLQYAIDGMLNGLDPHSAYLDARQFKQLEIDTSGRFGGLGIVIAPDQGLLKVVSAIDGTPAQRAGLRSGDLIVRIDGQSVRGLRLDQAVQRLRGKPGTRVRLEIIRPGAPNPLHLTLTREIITIDSVKGRLLEPGFAYVRIASFQSDTAAALRHTLHRLEKRNKAPLRGLVLDLRNNPGGLLRAAVGVADTFLNGGVIVSTKGRMPDATRRYMAGPGDALNGAPMVGLVNGGTASAAEIVAGALKDHGRALILGTRTFGKGSVQTVLPLSRDTAIKLTTALYYTPDGRSIQAEGIQPDIVIEPLQVRTPGRPEMSALREADLAGHLQNPDHAAAEAGAAAEPRLAERDFQLYEALTVLKSLALAQEAPRRAQGKPG